MILSLNFKKGSSLEFGAFVYGTLERQLSIQGTFEASSRSHRIFQNDVDSCGKPLVPRTQWRTRQPEERYAGSLEVVSSVSFQCSEMSISQ